MGSIRGMIHNGIIQPERPLEGFEGRPVLITILDEPEEDSSQRGIEESWDRLSKLIEQCKLDTGIGDLAHQHDHHLYGTPKKP